MDGIGNREEAHVPAKYGSEKNDEDENSMAELYTNLMKHRKGKTTHLSDIESVSVEFNHFMDKMVVDDDNNEDNVSLALGGEEGDADDAADNSAESHGDDDFHLKIPDSLGVDAK